MHKFGEKMQELRMQKRLTQKEMATICGISHQAISRYETGTAEPDIAMMMKIATLLNTDLNTLAGFKAMVKQPRKVFMLTQKEIEIIKVYRCCSIIVQNSVLHLLNENKKQ